MLPEFVVNVAVPAVYVPPVTIISLGNLKGSLYNATGFNITSDLSHVAWLVELPS